MTRPGRARASLTAATLMVIATALACASHDPAAPAIDDTVASIAILQSTVAIGLGASLQLTAFAYNKSGKTIGDSAGFTWASSNASIARIDASGSAFGVALGGPVVVTASKDGFTATASVSVVPASIAISPAVTALAAGQSVQLTATALDASGAPISAGATAWSTNDNTVATVSPSGLLTAVASGMVTVNADIAGKRGIAPLGVPSDFDGVWQGPLGSPPIEVDVVYGTVTTFIMSNVRIVTCAPTSLFIAGSARIANNQFSLVGAASLPLTDLNGTRTRTAGFTVNGVLTNPTTMTVTTSSFSVGQVACPNSSVVVSNIGPLSLTLQKP